MSEISGLNSPMLKTVFSPIRINSLDLSNRVLMSSMHLNYEGENQFDRMAQFYASRSENGPGIIVTAGCSPDMPGRAMLNGFSIDSDDLINHHNKIVSAVHAVGGSKIALQLLHFGREAFHGKLVAPSPLRLEGNLFTPSMLSDEQIFETISSYARAAKRAVEAGYDAIEIVFSQGFLIHQFLSPHTNHRTDEWGGNLAQRMQLARLVSEAIRNAVGLTFPLIFRIPCLDLLDNGLAFENSVSLIRALETFGIDLLNVSIGWHESDVPTLATIVPQAGFASVAARIKQKFPHLLVCVSNRINDLRHGEELLIAGAADMVAMGRPFLSDRQIVIKSKQSKFDEINQCIACNQDCLDHVFLGEEVGCSVNPEAGTHLEGIPLPMLPDSPQIAVVGGGLAGMSAAYFLAMRGARVTLFERAVRLGGQMILASKIPSKGEYLMTVRYLEGRLLACKVQIVLNYNFQTQDVLSQPWSHIVVATGTKPNFGPNIAQEGSRVISYFDLLEKDLPVAYPVVILGGGGVACDVAKYLLHRKSRIQAAEEYLQKFNVAHLVGPLGEVPRVTKHITIVQRSSKKIAYKLGRTTRWITLNELAKEGVKFIRGGTVNKWSNEGVVVSMINGEEKVVPAKTLVIALGQHSETDDLESCMSKAGTPYTIIGAADTLNKNQASISSSIRSGYDFAMNLCAEATDLPLAQRGLNEEKKTAVNHENNQSLAFLVSAWKFRR